MPLLTAPEKSKYIFSQTKLELGNLKELTSPQKSNKKIGLVFVFNPVKLMKKVIWKINQEEVLEDRGLRGFRRNEGLSIRTHVSCVMPFRILEYLTNSIFLIYVYAT